MLLMGDVQDNEHGVTCLGMLSGDCDGIEEDDDDDDDNCNHENGGFDGDDGHGGCDDDDDDDDDDDALNGYAAMGRERSGQYARYRGAEIGALLVEKARSEDDVQTEKAWLQAEKVWLIHRGGFSEAYLQTKGDAPGGLPEGRVRVRLESGDVIEVDEDDIEKANPPQFDRAEDLACLRYLNESSSLHTLRQRFAGNLIHTYTGPHLLVLNPMQQLPIYAEKIIQLLRGCKQEDMPPHIFSMGQVLYRDMLSSRRDQSLLLLGKSGSGKTTNAQHVLHYLIAAAGCVGGVLSVEKLASVYTLLHAFGNSRTSLNVNASHFTQIFTLDFDQSGQIGSASVQALMFEKARVVRRPEGEPTFSIFYQLLAGADSSLRNELQLQTLGDSILFMVPLQKPDDKQRASEAWTLVLQSFDLLGFSSEEVKSILSVLAAIFHLGNAGAGKGPTNKAQFMKQAAAQRAANLLGTSLEELTKSCFSGGGGSTLSRATSLR
ncbi:myosin-XVIIIa [Elysia marginata]|uniref:Myosin-XVIIIa n=1 Tax=Elysia marginata TaxID=1093978 RepID=A0AAV4JJX6_9GAST|nr:myosin-XVIIIa [Elysia marginata]